MIIYRELTHSLKRLVRTRLSKIKKFRISNKLFMIKKQSLDNFYSKTLNFRSEY